MMLFQLEGVTGQGNQITDASNFESINYCYAAWGGSKCGSFTGRRGEVKAVTALDLIFIQSKRNYFRLPNPNVVKV